jgi:hypothetical protein
MWSSTDGAAECGSQEAREILESEKMNNNMSVIKQSNGKHTAKMVCCWLNPLLLGCNFLHMIQV